MIQSLCRNSRQYVNEARAHVAREGCRNKGYNQGAGMPRRLYAMIMIRGGPRLSGVVSR